MDRRPASRFLSGSGVPRACGDGPPCSRRSVATSLCSPRMRGWTADRPGHEHENGRVPRACWDGPATGTAHFTASECSPRMRGWPARHGSCVYTALVFRRDQRSAISRPRTTKAPLLRGFDGPACHVPGVVLGLGKTVGQHHAPVNACNREALCGISAPAGSRGSCTGIFERFASEYRTLAADLST